MELTTHIQILERALSREKAARKMAEGILEQKSSEMYLLSQELKDSNNRLEELLGEKTIELEGVFINIVDAYVVMDMSGNVLKMNDAATSLLAHDLSTEKLNLLSLLKKEYFDYTLKAFSELNRIGYYKNYIVEIITKDKTEKIIQVNASIIKDKTGKPIAAQGIVRDITQETFVKELVDEQKRKLGIIMDNSPIGIGLADKKLDHFIMANNSLCKMFGYNQHEFQNLTIKDITHPDDIDLTKLTKNKIFSNTQKSITLEKRYFKKSNEIIWSRTTITPVRDSSNNLKYVVVTFEDVTEQKSLEKQKEDLLLSLESRNEQLNDYAHIVSHDLKSPLRSISALLSWTKDDHKDLMTKESMTNLDLIQEKVEKMDALIENILKYSSIDNAHLKHEVVDITELVNRVLNLIHIPSNIVIEVSDNLPCLQGNATRLQQLFQNLIGNAINAINKENGKVSVKWSEDSSHYIFSIKDNGIGIPEKNHDKIFKIFNSFNSSSGIGLSIVKKIVEGHKGKIWLESEVDLGTTFFFSIKK
tara:strand:+ start:4487 stop:6079 length:1593 start_codon:yes stop_codon:yes gene_type:complete